MGLWLAENDHDVVSVARCACANGRVLAKVCEAHGLRWTWFASLRITPSAFIEDELEELRDLPTIDGGTHPEEIDDLIAQVRREGAINAPPMAYPAEQESRALVDCPSCRGRYRVQYQHGVLSASFAPKGEPLR